MIQSQILYLMTGLLFGTTLLAVGLALGFWMARRTTSIAPLDPTPAKLDPREFLAMIRAIAESTTHIAADISQYQVRMRELVEMSRQLPVKDAAELKPILDQILEANSRMQNRLEAAEKKLEEQHRQLENYLTEVRTDALTGLPNRRALDQGLDELFEKHQRYQQPLSLVLLDVDHFKKINDTYGHAVGDVVLKRVADHLAASASECHLVARYGGEEFGILLADNVENAMQLAESVRFSLAADTIEAEGHTIRVTLSAGAAPLTRGERIGDLVRHSDQALYQAKAQGRNRVVLYQPAVGEAAGRDPIARDEAAGGKTEIPSNAPTSPPISESPSPSLPDIHETLRGIEEIEKRLREHLNQMVLEESKRSTA